MKDIFSNSGRLQTLKELRSCHGSRQNGYQSILGLRLGGRRRRDRYLPLMLKS